LFDLGMSSPQLDDPARGFSFRADGPLDMRMDPSQGMSAAEWLAVADENQIKEVIRGYGEERFAKQVAAAIAAARRDAPIRTTRQLADLVGAAVRTREPGQDPATRTFQALRIFVNRELEEVSLMLPQAVARLAPVAPPAPPRASSHVTAIAAALILVLMLGGAAVLYRARITSADPTPPSVLATTTPSSVPSTPPFATPASSGEPIAPAPSATSTEAAPATSAAPTSKKGRPKPAGSGAGTSHAAPSPTATGRLQGGVGGNVPF
jgi:hypothetical protein